MHETDVNTEIFNKQANSAVNTTALRDIHQLSFDIGISARDGLILIDAAFEALDAMGDIPPHLMRSVNAVNCFATCAKRHLALIVEANENVQVTIAKAVAQ